MVKPGTRKRENREEVNGHWANSFTSSGFPSDDTIVPGVYPYKITLCDVLARARARRVQSVRRASIPPICENCDYRNKTFYNPSLENRDRWCLIAMLARQKERPFKCPLERGGMYGKTVVVSPQEAAPKAIPNDSAAIKGNLLDVQRQFVPHNELKIIYSRKPVQDK